MKEASRRAATACVAVVVATASALAIRQTEALASAGQIVVLSANVFTGTLDELAGEFERATGHSVNILYGTAAEIRQRVEAGEFCDVTILPRPMMNDVLRQGRVAENTIVDFARSSVGVAVRAGVRFPEQGERGFQPKMNSPSKET